MKKAIYIVLFFLAGVALISFIGFLFMLFNDYTTWQRIGAVFTTLIAGGAGYYIYKRFIL